MYEHAQHSSEISEAVENIASNHLSTVSGELRLAAPPSISDSFLAPLIGAFQASYPKVRVQVFITDRIVDHIAEGEKLTIMGKRPSAFTSILQMTEKFSPSPAGNAIYPLPASC